MENPPVEDVFPIENEDFNNVVFVFRGVPYLCSETKRPLRYPLVGHRSIHQQCARDPSHSQWRRPARFRVTSHISVPVSIPVSNPQKDRRQGQKMSFKTRKSYSRTFDWDLYVYIHIHTYISLCIYIYWKRFAEFCCFSSWSQSFSGNGFCWLARGSSQEQGNDAIYCHDPIKQAVQRVQTGCQYGGIHHLRCSSIFVETPQKHLFISSQTASARCFVQKHTSSWKNFGFNIFSIIWIFQYLNQTHATKRPPSRFRAHWWRSPRCPPSWCSWEYCPPWNWNGWRLPGMWTWQLRIPDSGWRKFPIILGPT